MDNENRAAPVEIIPDKPINDDTGFGFDAYIKTLTDLIANSKNETPLVIGIYGEWGSGKTTLMKSVQKELDTDKRYEKMKLIENVRPSGSRPGNTIREMGSRNGVKP